MKLTVAILPPHLAGQAMICRPDFEDVHPQIAPWIPVAEPTYKMIGIYIYKEYVLAFCMCHIWNMALYNILVCSTPVM